MTCLTAGAPSVPHRGWQSEHGHDGKEILFIMTA